MAELAARGGGAGFEANPELMVGEAATLEDASRALAAVSRSLLELPCGSAHVFGEIAAAEAYANFVARWTDELSTQIGAMEELAGEVRACAANYDHLDQVGAADLGKTGADEEPPGNGSLGELGGVFDALTSRLPDHRPG